MKLTTPRPGIIEILETRVAPAIFFLSGAPGDLKIRNSANEDVTGVSQFGATATLVMKAGDSLFFDSTGNAKAGDEGDYLLATVSGGRALLFFDDFGNGAGGAADGRFDKNEISGLMVGNGFRGVFNTDINGTVLGALKADGTFNVSGGVEPQPATIQSLIVRGQVNGHILTGGGIHNVSVGSALFNVGTSPLSVVGIVANGTSSGGQGISFANGSSLSSTTAFDQIGNAPAITNVRLTDGALEILSGVGDSVPSGRAGNGGTISGLVILDAEGLSRVQTGSGGAVTNSGTGGNGGSIVNSRITVTSNLLDTMLIIAGDGGSAGGGAGTLIGGNGGSLLGVHAHVKGDLDDLVIGAGSGGTGRGLTGRGGSGGGILNSSVIADGNIAEISGPSISGGLVMFAGRGGSVSDPGALSIGGSGGALANTVVKLTDPASFVGVILLSSGTGASGGLKGGAGGDISKLTMEVEATVGLATDQSDAVRVSALGGGFGVNAGRGGALLDSHIFFRNSVFSIDLSITAGFGGSVTGGGAGVAGLGGNVVRSTVTVEDVTGPFLVFRSGIGGSGGSSNTSGGKGGDLIASSVVINGTVSNSVLLGAGNAGSTGAGPQSSASGASGGSVLGLSVLTGPDSFLGGTLSITGGNAAAAGAAGSAAGGAGGALKGLALNVADIVGEIRTQGGSGGAGSGTGRGGSGGAVDGLNLSVSVEFDAGLRALGGAGGLGGPAGGVGGAGGAVRNTQITGGNTSSGSIEVSGGAGGQANEADGGHGGGVSGVRVNVLGTVAGSVRVASGAGGLGGSSDGDGGNSGAVSNVTLLNRGGLSVFTIESAGANPIFQRSGRDGGHSGAVSRISILNYGPILQTSTIASGIGGSPSSTQGNGGSSGAVSEISIVDEFGGSAIQIFAGQGKDASGVGTRGGSVGPISRLVLNAPDTEFRIGSAAIDGTGAGNGGTGAAAVGGTGGAISGITGRVGVLEVGAPAGGDTVAGRGGPGGAITNIRLTEVSEFVFRLAAGDGGSGAVPAVGGNISQVAVAGSIGDFAEAFEPSSDFGMGGLFAGLGGTNTGTLNRALNGNVTDIRAERIAVIIAGQPSANAITSANEVNAIARITASVIGAETGISGTDFLPGQAGIGRWDYLDNNGNNIFDAGDQPVDGFVLVKGAKLTAVSVTPFIVFGA